MQKTKALERLGFENGLKKIDDTHTLKHTVGNGFEVIVSKSGQADITVKAGMIEDKGVKAELLRIAEDFQELLGLPDEPEPVEAEIVEPEPVKAELVEEPESLRAKAHKIEQPIKPQRIVSIKPGRMIKNLNPVLMECGKIKIGGKGEKKKSQYGNEFRAPVKFNHFVVTTMNKNEMDDFEPDTEIMSILGDDPTQIPVRLPHDTTDLNFPTCYAYYDSAKCQCRGDGETAITAEGTAIECKPETCKKFQEKKCKPNGVLSVILDDAPRVGGVYKFRTTSWNSINNLIASMEFIRRLTNGMLAGLPLMLTLTPKHTTIPGTKMPTTIYMVNLEYRGSLKEMSEARREALETREKMQYSIEDFEKLVLAELEAPESAEEARDIQEEFYPE